MCLLSVIIFMSARLSLFKRGKHLPVRVLLGVNRFVGVLVPFFKILNFNLAFVVFLLCFFKCLPSLFV